MLSPRLAYDMGKKSLEVAEKLLRRLLRSDQTAVTLLLQYCGECVEECSPLLPEPLTDLSMQASLRWALRPSGPPPSVVYEAACIVACCMARRGVPLSEKVVEDLLASLESEETL